MTLIRWSQNSSNFFPFQRNKKYMNPVLPFILKQFNKYWHSTILTFATCPKVSSRATMLSTGWYKQINYSWNLTEISKIHSPSEFPQKWVPSSGAMIYFWRTAFCCSLSIFMNKQPHRHTNDSLPYQINTSSCSKKLHK